MAKNKILIIDDDPRNIFALSLTLKAKKLEYITCTNAKDAIEIVKNPNDIALILMDIMMPEMDGYEAIRIIRETKNNEEIPIIAVTAQAMPQDRKKCLDAGAQDYISKPIDVDQLMIVIKKLGLC